ncbi:MAG TPA: nucleoside 2-deoxyribosyltransferase [Chthoniobacterales bacterium]|nr:nucleoside 2-deoxyribosyltransferase [Chthoniobacterales bacterium]
MFLVYFAGELFSSKHLMGNAALGDAIARLSNRNFSCVLPQTLEDRDTTARAIRDKDIVTLIGCDLALFNFDGPELDSGTVAEFMLAKFADIPSLLLRTDFRRAGDQGEDQWNLMLSFYPRTRSLFINSMEIYKNALSTGSEPIQAAQQLIYQVAGMAVTELEQLINEAPTISKELAEPIFRWLTKMPGFNSSENEDKVMAALAKKQANRLLP